MAVCGSLAFEAARPAPKLLEGNGFGVCSMPIHLTIRYFGT